MSIRCGSVIHYFYSRNRAGTWYIYIYIFAPESKKGLLRSVGNIIQVRGTVPVWRKKSTDTYHLVKPLTQLARGLAHGTTSVEAISPDHGLFVVEIPRTTCNAKSSPLKVWIVRCLEQPFLVGFKFLVLSSLGWWWCSPMPSSFGVETNGTGQDTKLHSLDGLRCM